MSETCLIEGSHGGAEKVLIPLHLVPLLQLGCVPTGLLVLVGKAPHSPDALDGFLANVPCSNSHRLYPSVQRLYKNITLRKTKSKKLNASIIAIQKIVTHILVNELA